jgi:prepilin-type processing-associated H-X9-DG protein
MGRWIVEDWGKTNKGWICPAAPERKPSKRDPWPGGPYLDDAYAGTVNTAWQGELSWSFPLFKGINLRERRAGSYEANTWIGGGFYIGDGNVLKVILTEGFATDAQIQDASTTPVLGDAVSMQAHGAWSSGWGYHGPEEIDLPPQNLKFGWGGNNDYPFYGMRAFCIPRHGSPPSIVQTNFPATSKLPGAINLSFADGHVQQTRLESLWQLTWHRDWKTPQKRPGLP